MSRILHLGKHYFPEMGGIETATQNLAEAGASMGHEVVCHVTGKSRARGRRFERNGVRVIRALTLGKFLSTPLAPSFLLPRSDRRALVHVHLPSPLAEVSLLMGTFFGGGAGLLPFVHALPRRGKGLGRIWYRCFTRALLRRSRRILISNPRLLDSFPELAEFREKLAVIPFGTEVLDARTAAESWRPGAREKLVLAVGRLVPYKGYHDLIQAWARSGTRGRGHKLVILGEGPLLASLRAEIKRLHLEKSVEIRVGCDDAEKRRLLLRASLFVMPSRDESETFGISALEALAHALPLLCSDLPTGLASLARNGACGATFAAGDISALAAGLDELVGGLRDLAGIGERNRQFAAEHFSKDALGARYGALLAECAARSN